MRITTPNGFTLVEILASLVLVSFLTAATLSFTDFVRRDITRQEDLASRNTEQGVFFNLLSQSAYVGALAEYESNKALRNCLDADGEMCTIKNDYPLSAYDLEQGVLMVSADPENAGKVKNEFSFQVHCPLNQLSCDQAEYISVKIRSSLKEKDGQQFSTEKVSVVQPKRSNVITMVPNTKLEEGSPVNIIIFVDGSNSMSGIQASFKETLGKLIDDLKYLDAKIALYPLSNHVQEVQSQTYIIDGTGQKVNITYADESTMGAGSVKYWDERWDLSPAAYNPTASWHPTPSIFNFTSDMPDTLRTATVTAMKSRVDSIFSENATSNKRDAGLCGMLRVLNSARAGTSPFTIDTSTPTVLMVLTNEDDESVLVKPGALVSSLPKAYTLDNDYACAPGITQKWTRAPGMVWYYGDKYTYNLTGTADFVIDGAPGSKAFTGTSTHIKYRATHVDGADCLADALSIDKAEVKSGLQYGASLPSGLTNYSLSTCKIKLVKGAVIGTAAEGTHPCEKVTLTSVPTVAPGTCYEKAVPATEMGWQGSGATFTGAYVAEDTQAHAKGSMPLAVYNLINKQFNLSNFILSMVINPSSGTCALTPGAAYGARYEELVNMAGVKGQIIPICASDYSDKILDLSKQLGTLGMNDFTLSPGLGNRVSGADIVRGANIIAATEGADFTRTGDVIVFKSGFLQSTDIVRFYLK